MGIIELCLYVVDSRLLHVCGFTRALIGASQYTTCNKLLHEGVLVTVLVAKGCIHVITIPFVFLCGPHTILCV